MAYSTIPKTKRDGVITLLDGTGTPVTLEVAYEDGNFTFSDPQQFSELVVMDRGNFAAVRKQDEQAKTGSFSSTLDSLQMLQKQDLSEILSLNLDSIMGTSLPG